MDETQWHVIEKNADIEEMRYDSGSWVHHDLSMCPINTRRTLYVIFQTQWKDSSVIEMQFEGVEWLNLRPMSENFSSNLSGAYMCFENKSFVWFSSDDFKSDYKELYEHDDITWIKANKAKWRRAESYLGEDSVYINREKA